MRSRYPSASSFLQRQMRPRQAPIGQAKAHAIATAIRRGQDARAAGAPIAANPYRETDFHAGWRVGWSDKDQELCR